MSTSTSSGFLVRRAQGALDLWSVKALTGYGLRLDVRTFRRLVVVAVVVVVPVTMLVVTIGVSLAATLVTDEPAGGSRNAAFAAGVGGLVAVALAYAGTVDLVRQHFTSTRYAVSRSPLKGMWLLSDIPVGLAVLVERGPALLWRALMQCSVLGAIALFVHRSGSARAGDLWALTWMVPATYLLAGGALAAYHATHDREVRGTLRLALVLLPLAFAGGVGLGVLAPGTLRAGAGSATGDGAVTAVIGVGDSLGMLRISALALLVLAVAAATVAAAATGDYDLTRQARLRSAPPVGDRPLGHVLFSAVGGSARMQVAGRVATAAWLGAAAAGGWRVAGGAVLPATGAHHLTGALMIAATAGGLAVAANALLLTGQTRLLWHYRTLWESGAGALRLYAASLRPTVLPAALTALGLVAVGRLLTGDVALGIAAALGCAVLSEHLVDSLFAKPDTHEGARTANSLLALVSYAFLAPTLVLGLAREWWTLPALAALAIALVTGGAWWFTRRVLILPTTVQ
jgi:hypothetical protein